jgi:peptidoglycan hydrolase CwlO-like protein
MSELKIVAKLKGELSTLEASLNKSEGIVDHLKEKMKTKYKVNSLEEAESSLSDLEEKVPPMEKELDSLLDEIEKELSS